MVLKTFKVPQALLTDECPVSAHPLLMHIKYL